jgi:hypothetical protein
MVWIDDDVERELYGNEGNPTALTIGKKPAK